MRDRESERTRERERRRERRREKGDDFSTILMNRIRYCKIAEKKAPNS